MYQNFNVSKSTRLQQRLKSLREVIKDQKLNGFLIPRSDLHQNEYIEPCDARLEWITGFTGSAGLCLVTLKSAFIFVDGRYKIQVEKETNKNLFNVIQTSEISFKNWFYKNFKNKTIGYDPWLHTVLEINELSNYCNTEAKIKKCQNLVDLIWRNKPRQGPQKIKIHPQKFSGTNSTIKKRLVAKSISNNQADAVILSKPESVCWLLNIRGKDISHTPLVQCLAIVKNNSAVKLFIREKNLSKKIISFLGDDVEIFDQSHFSDYVSRIKNQSVQIDPSSCPMNILDLLKVGDNNIIHNVDPCMNPKAIKNKTEIKGARTAHTVDATAFINFLYWFETNFDSTKFDEILVTKKLEEFRTRTGLLEEIAFDTICGSGSNGAIIHYKVNKKTNKKIEDNNLLLIDSGGQYQMGTTDLTRTIAISKPNKKMINIFTQILKGLITLSDLKWPLGLSGQHIDSLARTPLWSIGLDYDHGTGHGVGSYLSVHEGPHGISKRNNIPLEAGMIVSVEPGYYEEGEFGIRIENLLLIKKLPKNKKQKTCMLSFESLTLVPIDKKLINVNALTTKEKDWLNSYHKLVYKKISPFLSTDIKNWLQKSCAPI